MQGRVLNESITASAHTRELAVLDLNAKTVDSLVGESIDQALDDLLGRRAKEAIYDYLERNYSLARDDIPKNMEKFFRLTGETFGKASRTIARCIVKRLWEKLGWKFEGINGFEFSDYLEMAKARIARELVQKAKASMLNRRQE